MSTSRRRSLATAALLVLLLGACGDDSTPAADGPGGLADLINPGDATDGPDGGDADDGPDGQQPGATGGDGEAVGTIEFALPTDTAVPTGSTTIGDACEGADRGGAVLFAHPGSWELTGWGHGGSGGSLGGSTTHTFATPGGLVSVEVAFDQQSRYGIHSGPGEEAPPESFDYEYTVGDRTIQVIYEEAMEVSVGDQRVTVWAIDEAAHPELVDGRQLRFRADAITVTWMDGDAQIVDSIVVTIDVADPSAIDEATIRSLIDSLHASECVRREATVSYEIITASDLDGDDTISGPEDYLELIG